MSVEKHKHTHHHKWHQGNIKAEFTLGAFYFNGEIAEYSFVKSYYWFKQVLKYVNDELLFHMLPNDIYISTMTITCKINNFKFNCENIARYVDLSYDGIIILFL